MLFMIVSLLTAPMAAQVVPSKSICDVGRAILADMLPGAETKVTWRPIRNAVAS